jgi:hypothetical protein
VKHFLIVYRRGEGRLLECRDLGTDRALATAERFSAEKRYVTDPDVEVLILSARSREVLERTHSRYFRTARQLTEDLRTAI